MLRAVLVDDEPLARDRLRSLLKEADIPTAVIGEAGSGKEAVPLIYELKPDVVFLDVQMPVLDGFDVVDLLPEPRPHVVFVTAYDEYALQAFEVHAVDYLTKPVRLTRVNATLSMLSDRRRLEEAARSIDSLREDRRSRGLRRLTAKAGRKLLVVQAGDIRWIEARDKLVFVHTEDGSLLTDFTLDELEHRLDPDSFIRVHRSHIVNAAYIRELIPWFAGTYVLKLVDGTELDVARRRVREVRKALGGD